MLDDEVGYSIPPPVCGVRTPVGDPNYTCGEKPHFDLIRTKLLEAMNNEKLPLEDRQSAERAFNQFYGRPNVPHEDVINGPDAVSPADIDKILPDILNGMAEGWVAVEPSDFAISPHGGIARSKQYEQAEVLQSELEKEIQQLESEQSQEEKEMKKEIGSIVVTENGNVVLLTSLDNQGELQGNGSVPVYDFGIILRGATVGAGSGARIPFPSSDNVRVVVDVSQALQLLEESGLDLKTCPEKPLSHLRVVERLERLERTAK